MINMSQFLLSLRLCKGSQEAISTVKIWSDTAAILLLQSHGDALMSPLITRSREQFSEVMMALAELNSESNQTPQSSWIYAQVLAFYEWLNTLVGLPMQEIECNWAQWQPARREKGENPTSAEWLVTKIARVQAKYKAGVNDVPWISE